MFELGVEADTLVGWCCWCTFVRPTGSVITVREPRAGVRFALRDDLRGSPDFFLGNSGMGSDRATAAAARHRHTAVLCRGGVKMGVVSKINLRRGGCRLFR